MTDPPLADRLAVMALTDPEAAGGTLEAARAALQAGVPALQLRWKSGTAREIFNLATDLRVATRAAGSLLIINDRIDIALAVGADGAHLGDDDLPLSAARSIAPEGFLLGRSVDTAAEASEAAAEGADYVGLGPVFATSSKADLGAAIGPRGVAAVRTQVEIPIVAIGGIDVNTAGEVVRAGADGIAVISAIMRAADPRRAAEVLLDEIRRAKVAR